MEKSKSKIFINPLKINKRGVAVSFLVGVIIVLFGFVMLLMFWYNLSQGIDVDREACRNSVILRGSLPSVVQGAKDLSCQTQKICITGKILGKGECDEFIGEEAVKTIRVSDNPGSLEKIEKIYAMEMVDCWSMMGKGEVSLYSQVLAENLGFGEVYPTCVICSRIAIDEESFTNVLFEQMDLYRYMATHAISGTDESYLQFLSGKKDTGFSLEGGTFDVGAVYDEDEKIKEPAEIEINTTEELEDELIPTETAIVFSQISAPEHSKVFENTAVASVGLIGFSGVARGVVMTVVKTAGVIPIVVASIGFLGVQQGYVAYNRAVVATTCSAFSVGDTDVEGCSSVRAVDYKLENILQYCGKIESLP